MHPKRLLTFITDFHLPISHHQDMESICCAQQWLHKPITFPTTLSSICGWIVKSWLPPLPEVPSLFTLLPVGVMQPQNFLSQIACHAEFASWVPWKLVLRHGLVCKPLIRDHLLNKMGRKQVWTEKVQLWCQLAWQHWLVSRHLWCGNFSPETRHYFS